MNDLPELEDLQRLIAAHGERVHAQQLGETEGANGRRYPLIGLVIGSRQRDVPTFGLFAGVHGLERIGSSTVLSYLGSLLENLSWDAELQQRFERCRVVSIPIVNPAGMAEGTRANPRGVDLMRNAPHDASERVPMLLGGHRISPLLPWYRGTATEPMQVEAQALCDFVSRELFDAPASIALDVHSGFGVVDRLWFPYARSATPFPDIDRVMRLRELLDRTYPYHVYRIEPQADGYLLHGDLWDHLHDAHAAHHRRKGGGSTGHNPAFIPLTLEMGSWTWVRKNPRQLFSRAGPFNPVLPHRLRRVLRRHLLLVDFLQRAVSNPKSWAVRPSVGA